MKTTWIIHAVCLLAWLAYGGCVRAEEAPSAAGGPPAGDTCETLPLPQRVPAPASADRAWLHFRDYTLSADHVSLTLDPPEALAQGKVVITTPTGDFLSDTARYNTATGAGMLEGARGIIAPFRFCAGSLAIDAANQRHIHDGRLTTCTLARPHYELRVRDFYLYPNDRILARNVSVEIAGRHLFTIPHIAGKLNDGNAAVAQPTIFPGYSAIDGVYLAGAQTLATGTQGELTLSARFGTQKMLRGALAYRRPFTLAPSVSGDLTLLISRRESVDNVMVGSEVAPGLDLRQLTISRLPGVELAVNPIPLPGRLQGLSLRVGAGAGQVYEHPTGVNRFRLQSWSILGTRAYPVGPLLFSAEYGHRAAYVSNDTYHTFASRLTLESRPTAPVYLNISHFKRYDEGRTPFIFDRVALAEELFTEADIPLTRNGNWRLDIWNRQDLDQRVSRDFNITGIYRLDCLSYGVSYNRATQTFGLGVVLNGFGTFHKKPGSIGFSQ